MCRCELYILCNFIIINIIYKNPLPHCSQTVKNFQVLNSPRRLSLLSLTETLLSLALFLYPLSLSICIYSFLCRYKERERERGLIQRKGLAGLRAIASRLGVLRRRKVKIKVMEWWHKMVFPVRRVWVAVAVRLKARKNGAGLLKLRDDIQTCGYEDVQVMWEMLRRSDSELESNKRKKRPFWRVFAWSSSNHSAADASSFSTAHA